MKSFVITLVTVATTLPGFAAADSWIERVVRDAQGGGGTVIIENSSSVSTGGQTAASGQAVSTGNSSASSKVETHINAGNDGGSVEVKVETSQDGVVETKKYSKELEPNEPVHVDVSAKVDAQGSNVEVRGWDPDTKKETTAEDTDTAGTASSSEDVEAGVTVRTTVEARVEKIFSVVPSFFKKVFSFFWRF